MLDDKDVEIKELRDKLDKLEDAESREWKWCIHSEVDNGNGSLPIPRLECRAKSMSGEWGNYTWEYSLIYQHFLGHFVKIPLGLTTCQSGKGNPPVRGATIDGPFRESAHIKSDSEELKLPAFFIVETDPTVIQKIN